MTGVALGLVGCQPEGTGTVKAPGPRGDDTALGRPFGNAPEVPSAKQAAPAPASKAPAPKGTIEPKNPRL
jgi:hypothetical protein